MPDLSVELAERRYMIHIDSGIPAPLREQVPNLLAQGRRAAVVADAAVVKAYESLVKEAFDDLPIFVVPSGEASKCFEQLEALCEFLAAERIDRTGALFALGGGVTGDLAGFAAASYLRGIDFYQVPTTLLAMVDSSVGGKTGINLRAGKNLVGAFWQPRAVFIGTAFLKTLSAREFVAGMAEVVKYGMLYDAELFARLEHLEALHAEHPELPEIIHRCCEIKAEIVREDETEQAGSGGRALLNLGHTFAHAIEAVAGYGEYLHGEAVAIGLVIAARLSERFGDLSEAEVARVKALLERQQLPVRLRNPLPLDRLTDAMFRDKKVRAGKLRFVAMERLGRAVTTTSVPAEWIEELWQEAGA